MLADCCIRSCPTRVDPVNESLRTEGFEVSSAPIPWGIPVTTEKTPFGMPARSASTASAKAENGFSSDGFATIGQPAASAGPALRVIIAFGKFHGVYRGGNTDGLLQNEDAAVCRGRRDGIAIEAALDEARAVPDLPGRFREGLALLHCHDQREVVDVFEHQPTPLLEQTPSLAARNRAPGRPGFLSRLDGSSGLFRAKRRYRPDLGAPVAGSVTATMGSPSASPHAPATNAC
jgi:hypothetical protein